MSDLRSLMKKISGNEPTPEQINRVMSIAHDMDISKTDPLLPLLVMLDQYHGVFSELPEKMKQAADTVAKEAAERTKHQVNLGLVSAVKEMGPQIGAAVVDHAKALNKSGRIEWIGFVVIIVSILVAMTTWLTHTSGYRSGFETGKAAGYATAADEKAMVAWANTEQGRMAFELSQAGSLGALANCNAKGWKLEKGICYPLSYKEGNGNLVSGWGVGKSAGGTPSKKINVSWLRSLFGGSA